MRWEDGVAVLIGVCSFLLFVLLIAEVVGRFLMPS